MAARRRRHGFDRIMRNSRWFGTLAGALWSASTMFAQSSGEVPKSTRFFNEDCARVEKVAFGYLKGRSFHETSAWSIGVCFQQRWLSRHTTPPVRRFRYSVDVFFPQIDNRSNARTAFAGTFRYSRFPAEMTRISSNPSSIDGGSRSFAARRIAGTGMGFLSLR